MYLNSSYITRREVLSIFGMGVLFVSGIGLVGCNSNERPSSQEVSSSVTPDDKLAAERPPSQTLSEAFKAQERTLWYFVISPLAGPGKDSEIWDIFVVENGQVTGYYTRGSVALGDLAKASDDAIVTFLEEHYQEERYGPVSAGFHIKTDNTGNKTWSEELSIAGSFSEEFDSPGDNGQSQIYDASFVGYSGYSTYLITRVESLTSYIFDEPGAEGVLVD